MNQQTATADGRILSFASVDEPVSRDYNNGQNNEGDTVVRQPIEFVPRSEVHKRFQRVDSWLAGVKLNKPDSWREPTVACCRQR